MSSSSLYGITIDGEGVELEEYRNSWLYAPQLWQYLFDALYTEAIKAKKFGPYHHYMQPDVMKEMYDEMMKWDNSPEQIAYFITMEYVFFAKDIPHVAKAIRDMIPKLNLSEDHSHIAERFEEMAKDIEAIDIVKYPYFVFKNTSVDDGVERWFRMYDEEEDDYREVNIFDRKDIQVVFVCFEEGHPKVLCGQHDIERVGV